MARGYYGVGVWHPKTSQNIGTLYRTAHNYGAAFVFTVGRRYKEQASDTTGATRHLPLYHFKTAEDLRQHLPSGCPLIGIEQDAKALSLERFTHPERACYLLGAEDHGLSTAMREACHFLVEVPGSASCLNVASAGSIVVYSRWAQRQGTRL